MGAGWAERFQVLGKMIKEMPFKSLLAAGGLEAVALGPQAQIRSVCIDSRQAGPGCCFVAMVGTRHDGHQFIAQAMAAGAAAVVAQRYVPDLEGSSHAIVPNTRTAAGRLAQAIRGNPAGKLTCIGITGTNGKTTVAHMIRSILIASGRRAGLIGTIAYDTGLRRGASEATTPDPIELARMTDEMVQAGRSHLVMEVSSHALDQDRTAGLDFQVGVFTNLTGDHLDYHQTMENYRRAKARLFEQLNPGATAVINIDDPSGEFMVETTGATLCRTSLAEPSNAELTARIERASADGSVFLLQWADESVRVETPLIGLHNVRNAMAAAGACKSVGVSLDTVARALREMPFVPGRLQRVGPNREFSVFVDYAHTDDALANVCQSLRPLTIGRLIVVFGCGGDRDRSKRPRMAQAAAKLADLVIVTSDNPRSEDPGRIIDDILSGLDGTGRRRAIVEPDRALAIDRAVSEAVEGDVVLIAGKGHETTQVIGDERIKFDDAAVALDALARRDDVGRKDRKEP